MERANRLPIVPGAKGLYPRNPIVAIQVRAASTEFPGLLLFFNYFISVIYFGRTFKRGFDRAVFFH